MKKRLREREERMQAAYGASNGFYTATLPAPPHPHIALGLAVGRECETAMEAVVSMQADAQNLGADGVLGVAICPVPSPVERSWFVAYGTAVKWAREE
jgi:hypothetical protein